MTASISKGKNTAKEIFTYILSFIKKNTVFCIALLAAAISSIFVPIDKEYIGYFDFKTLSCLFSVLAVVGALKNIKFFTILARKIVEILKNTRAAVIGVVYTTFIGSMLIANDMALITFLPLGYFVLTSACKEKYIPFTFIMQNIAANLGGMLTPFGNPQNLYLYSKFNISNAEFLSIMALPFLFAVALITLVCVIFIKKEPLEICEKCEYTLNKPRTAVYLVLFALAIIIVFRAIPYYIGLAIIFISLMLLDRKALKTLDYPLLLTFAAFFVFSGNMARIDIVRDFFSSLLDKSTLIVSTLSSQFISNVPSAILLSQFTDNYKELLLGVNIGGVGTLISSLASLITLREYQKIAPDKIKKYILLFSALNFSFLIILTAFAEFIL